MADWDGLISVVNSFLRNRGEEVVYNLKSIRKKYNQSAASSMGYRDRDVLDAAYEFLILTKGEKYQKKLDKKKENLEIPQFCDFLIGQLGPKWPHSMIDELIDMVKNDQGKEEKDLKEDEQKEREVGEERKKHEVGEERKKHSDEVNENAGGGSDDADVHGGDGNSGEVDSAAKTKSNDKRTGQKQKQEQKADNESFYNLFKQIGFETDKKEKYIDNIDILKKFEKALYNLKKQEEKLDEIQQKEAERENKFGFGNGGGNKLDASSCPSYGGECSTIKEVERRAKKLDQGIVKNIIKHLKSIFNKMDNLGLEESPRIDKKKLVVEVLSKSYRINRARKTELGDKVKLFMCDVSGSCSAVSDETLLACKSIADKDMNVVIIVHSNGEPVEMYSKNKQLITKLPELSVGVEWWNDYLTKYDVVGAVNFGDWDAGYVLKMIAQQAPLVWLDSYCAKDGVKLASLNHRCDTLKWKHLIAFVQGVNDGETAEEALKWVADHVKKNGLKSIHEKTDKKIIDQVKHRREREGYTW